MSLDRFQKDMAIVKESLRLAYGPWTKREILERKIANVLITIVEIVLLLGVLSVPFLIYLMIKQ